MLCSQVPIFYLQHTLEKKFDSILYHWKRHRMLIKCFCERLPLVLDYCVKEVNQLRSPSQRILISTTDDARTIGGLTVCTTTHQRWIIANNRGEQKQGARPLPVYQGCSLTIVCEIPVSAQIQFCVSIIWMHSVLAFCKCKMYEIIYVQEMDFQKVTECHLVQIHLKISNRFSSVGFQCWK